MLKISSRRWFVGSLASFAGLAAFRSAGDAAAQTTSPSAGPFDMAWLEQMKGKHKQLYDLGSIELAVEGRPLRFCKNFLDTFDDVYKLKYPELNSAVGI